MACGREFKIKKKIIVRQQSGYIFVKYYNLISFVFSITRESNNSFKKIGL